MTATILYQVSCDICNATEMEEISGIEMRGILAGLCKDLRAEGWKISRDLETILCPNCVGGSQ